MLRLNTGTYTIEVDTVDEMIALMQRLNIGTTDHSDDSTKYYWHPNNGAIPAKLTENIEAELDNGKRIVWPHTSLDFSLDLQPERGRIRQYRYTDKPSELR